MILGAVDGDWIVPLLVVVFGFLNWVWGKINPAKTPPAVPQQRRPTSTSRPSPSGSPEEERMKKFLEALGVPTDDEPSVEVERPIPRRPPPIPREQRRQVRPPEIPQPSSRPLTPPPLVRRAAPAPEPRSLDSLPEPMLPVELLSTPELIVPTVAEYDTVSSHVGAIPGEKRPAPAQSVDEISRGELMRRELSSPAQLRSAFLLREILGPPRSLQA